MHIYTVCSHLMMLIIFIHAYKIDTGRWIYLDVLRQLKAFYWAERKFMFTSIFCLMCATALGLVYPNLLRYLIDDVITPKKFELVPTLAFTVVGVIIIKGCMQYLHGFLVHDLVTKWRSTCGMLCTTSCRRCHFNIMTKRKQAI